MEVEFFTHTAALAALAVVAVQQILKLKIIPSQIANRYPVPTNIVLSVIAAVIATTQGDASPDGWTGWLLMIATVSVVASIVYNNTLKSWSELRSMEG
jgi:hypothetical protein